MCILFLAINQHPEFPLVIAANRDEYHDRPSSTMHYWPDHPRILAGRDQRKGGTWLGINQSGKFCAVTNFRTVENIDPDALSRGELVKMYLDGTYQRPGGDLNFHQFLVEQGENYGPFNLVFGDIGNLHVYCNQNNILTRLGDGFHSLSNGFIDQHWPKMSLGVKKLSSLISQSGPIEIDTLNQIMHDQTLANEDDLPDTGVSKQVERYISSIFIQGEQYGTRTTSYIIYSPGLIQAHELNYSSSGSITDQQSFTIEISW